MSKDLGNRSHRWSRSSTSFWRLPSRRPFAEIRYENKLDLAVGCEVQPIWHVQRGGYQERRCLKNILSEVFFQEPAADLGDTPECVLVRGERATPSEDLPDGFAGDLRIACDELGEECCLGPSVVLTEPRQSALRDDIKVTPALKPRPIHKVSVLAAAVLLQPSGKVWPDNIQLTFRRQPPPVHERGDLAAAVLLQPSGKV